MRDELMFTGLMLTAFGIAITACGVTATYTAWRDDVDAAYDASASQSIERMAGHAELTPAVTEPEPTLADEYEHRFDEHGARRVVQVAPIIGVQDEQQFDSWPVAEPTPEPTGWGDF